jgi:early secretory antigenic target protein ESAT-6
MAVSDSQIYVDYGNVSNVYQSLEEADAQIQQVLTQLEDVINPLRASWSGASETEYTSVQARWNNDMGQMNSLLGTYRNTLDEMTNNYGTTDNSLANQWSSIT